MKYLKVFTDFAVSLEPYSDAEIGRLFMAMMKYAETSELPELRGNERMIWPTAKLNIDRTRKESEKQAKNGRLGGRPKTQENPEKPKQTQKSQKDKDKDKENIPPIVPPGGWGDVSPELLAALARFEEMRRKMRKPLTDYAKELNLKKLRKLAADEETQIAIVERSIERGWQGFFALDKQQEAQPPKDKLLTLEDIYGRRGAERFRGGS